MTTERALCATEIRWTGDLWFSTNPADREQAKTICRACPLVTACATTALANPAARGVWGALSTRDRANLRGEPLLGPDPDDAVDAADTTGAVPVLATTRRACGTENAFTAHRRYGETCATCEAAHDARVEAGRRVRLAEEHALGGSEAGYHIHRRLGEEPCGGCRAESSREQGARAARRRAERRRVWAAGGRVSNPRTGAQAVTGAAA